MNTGKGHGDAMVDAVEEAEAGAAAPDGVKQRDAFISYSQSKNAPLAKQLQRGLERLAVSRFRPMRMSVFRDVTSLPANHDLWQSIQRELARSRYLILLASPEAAVSPWVAKEVDYWLRERDAEHLLIAVASGGIDWDDRAGDFDWEKTTCLPRNLAGHFTSAPLWVDLRQIRERGRVSLRYPPFRAAVAALAAPLHGRPKEELEHDDFRWLRFVRRLIWSGVALLVTLLVLAVYGFFDADRQRDVAEARAHTSASQALAARSGQLLETSPNQAAQYALYAEETGSTPEARRALAQAMIAQPHATRRLRAGAESVSPSEGPSTAAPTYVVLSADGSTAAYSSAFDDRDGVRVYDAPSARQRRVLGGGIPLALSRDGRFLAMWVKVNRVQLWDTRTGKLLRTMSTRTPEDLHRSAWGFQAFALSPDGRWLAAVHETRESERFLVVWRASDGFELTRRRMGDSPIGLGFTREGRLVLVDTERQETSTFEPAASLWSGARSLRGIPGGTDSWQYEVLLFDGARKALIVGTERAEIWDLRRHRRIAAGSVGAHRSMTVADDGGSFAVSKEDGTVRLYDAALRPGTTLGRLARPANTLAASADGTQVVVGSYGGELTLFSTVARRGAQVSISEEEFTPGDLTPDGRAAVVRNEVGPYTAFWDPRTGRRIGEIPYASPSEEQGDTAYVVSGDRRHVAVKTSSILGDGEISIWELSTGEKVDCGSVGEYGAGDFFYLPGDRYLVVVSDVGVELFDTRACVGRTVMPLGETGGFSLALSGDRRTLVVLEEVSREVDTWRWNGDDAFEHVGNATLPEEDVPTGSESTNIGVDHDGTRAAFSAREGHVYVVRLDSGQLVRASGSLPNNTSDVVFSRDGRLVIQGFRTGSTQGLRLWDANTGDLLDVWTTDPPSDASKFDDDVQVVPGPANDILTLGPDHKVVRRTVGVEAWRDLLCGLVSQPLPARERDRYLEGLDVKAPCG